MRVGLQTHKPVQQRPIACRHAVLKTIRKRFAGDRQRSLWCAGRVGGGTHIYSQASYGERERVGFPPED